MLKVSLTLAADADLDENFAYTLERYGSNQARRYGAGFIKTFDAIAEFPQIGSDQGNIQPGLRRLVHQSHAIYYRINGNEIVVARILGPGQDPLEAL